MATDDDDGEGRRMRRRRNDPTRLLPHLLTSRVPTLDLALDSPQIPAQGGSLYVGFIAMLEPKWLRMTTTEEEGGGGDGGMIQLVFFHIY